MNIKRLSFLENHTSTYFCRVLENRLKKEELIFG